MNLEQSSNEVRKVSERTNQKFGKQRKGETTHKSRDNMGIWNLSNNTEKTE